MPAFSGKYYYTVDPKGRLIIPAPFRDIITAHYSAKLYVTNALFDKCLHIYPEPVWEELADRVTKLPSMKKSVRLFQRKVMSSAIPIELDKQSRVLIPQAHREDAGINGDVVVVGLGNKIELWNKGLWDLAIDETQFDRDEVENELSIYGL